MFKTILLLICVVALGFLSAQFFPNIGEIGILFAHTKISLPITVLISLVLVFGVLLFIIVRSIFGIYFIAKKFMQVLVGKDRSLALLMYDKAMYEQFIGNYLGAQRLFIKAASALEQPLIGYLQAAKCAQLLKNYQMRDKFMLTCYQKFIENSSLINFQYALMCEEQGDYEKSLSLLLSVDADNVHYEELLRLKSMLFYKTNNFNKLSELLPTLHKLQVFDVPELTKIQLATYNHALHSAANNQEELENVWSQLPKNLRAMPGLLITYTSLLAHLDNEQAETILRKAIDVEYHPLMAAAYGKLESINLGKQIAHAEEWYHKHADDYALNICLAKLCLKHKLWGKAKDYLEKSLVLKSDQNSLIEYARVCALIGDHSTKIEALEKVLRLMEAG